MKKISLLVLAAATMFTACKKESLKPSLEPTTLERDEVAKISEIKEKVQNSPTDMGYLSRLSLKTEAFRRKCQSSPVGVGTAISVNKILPHFVSVDYYGFYEFFRNGRQASAKMMLRVSWGSGYFRHLAIYPFKANTTLAENELGVVTITSIVVPKDKSVTFTLIGKNICGETSKYETEYTYSSTVQFGSNAHLYQETSSLLERTTTIGTPVRVSSTSE